jgi:phage tail protein X
MNRYANITLLRNENPNVGTLGTKYYKTTFYPEIPLNENDIYVITDFGDRLDLLAYQFYQDITLYWIISAANPNSVKFGSIFIPQGTQLRIPTNTNNIINSYKNLNNI